jgi:hypothetical protein
MKNRGIERDCGKNRIEIEAHGQFFKIMFQLRGNLSLKLPLASILKFI